MLKFLILICIAFYSSVTNLFGQVVIVNTTITSPPAPTPSTNPIDLSTGVSVEYNAEQEITLVDGFWAKENTTGGQTYFWARLVSPPSYAELKNKLDGSFTSTRMGALYFKYTEKYIDGSLNYTIYDYQRNVLLTSATLPVAKVVGTNFVTLNLKPYSAFIATSELNSYYILEVTNDKGDKYLLRFKYSN